MSNKYPKEWKPTKVHLKSGWKNNPTILSAVVTAINDEIYVEDEDAMMEKIDIALEYLKAKYNITKKP